MKTALHGNHSNEILIVKRLSLSACFAARHGHQLWTRTREETFGRYMVTRRSLMKTAIRTDSIGTLHSPYPSKRRQAFATEPTILEVCSSDTKPLASAQKAITPIPFRSRAICSSPSRKPSLLSTEL